MKIVDEIIEVLSSEGSSLNDALLKTKVLLHRLGEKELVGWVNLELQGYKDSDALPDYRKISMSVRGNISNGAYRYADQALPTGHLKEPLKSRLDKTNLMQSIAVLESYADDDNNLSVSLAPEIYQHLSEPFGNSFEVEQAWGKHSLGGMLQVVTEVKSRLLGFVLELSDRIPEELDRDGMKEASQQQNISDLFNNTVIGDNATFVIGDNNVQNVKNNISLNDFDSLAAELVRHQVAAEDIEELRDAIAADEGANEHKDKSFGSNVNTWIGKMVGKAASSSWAVSVGAAGSLAATAIKTYYGF
jgi:predicted transcriptional regulator